MVTAQLYYNPYLSEIEIKFNDRDPHINSLVYKYQDHRLGDWISLLPGIFRDEMNGYYFQLEFSGTRLDYEQLQAEFRTQGVSEQVVPCVLTRELDDREIKLQEISDLLSWLESNPNRTFNYSEFKQSNTDILEISYPLIMLHGAMHDFPMPNIPGAQVESVTSVDELAEADLTDTPLVYIINQEAAEHIHEDMKYLLERNDFEQRQLFFVVANTASTERARKFLQDIGIDDPMIISTLDDSALHKYCLVYPVTDYIHKSLIRIHETVKALKDQENIEREEHEKANREIYNNIENIDNRIARLKKAQEDIGNIPVASCPAEWDGIEQKAFDKISKWKLTKIKTTSNSEAAVLSQDLSAYMATCYGDFADDLNQNAYEMLERMHMDYNKAYQNGGEDLEYIPDIGDTTFEDTTDVPDIAASLMELRSEGYVIPNDDLFSKIFMQQDHMDKTPVLQRTYTYKDWRNYTRTQIASITSSLKSDWLQLIVEDLEDYRQQYEDHIQGLLEDLMEKREQIASQLSDDEQEFQSDINWLTTFDEQLGHVERG